MTIRIEFYGIPRQYTQTDAIEITADRLGEALSQMADQFPELAAHCFSEQGLQPGYLMNVNGQFFTSDPQTSLKKNDVLLLLSADVGG